MPRRVEEALRSGWLDLDRHAATLAALPAFTEQPRLNLGSLRQPEASSFLGPPRTRWLRRSGKGLGLSLMASPLALVVGTCDTDPTPDYYECVDYQAQALHPDTGDLLFTVPDRFPLGLHADVLVCMSPDLSPVVEGRSLRDGALLWSLRPSPKDPTGLVTPGGLYFWTRSSHGEGLPVSHRWPEPRRAPEAPEPLRGLPPGRVGYVHACGGLVAVQTWWPDPVRSRLDVLRRPGWAPVWEHVFEDYVDHDLLTEPEGWVFRTGALVEVHGPRRRSLAGMSRFWPSPRWIVGVRGEDVVAASRATGEEWTLGLPTPWDLAVAGDTVWAAARAQDRLFGCTARGERLWEGRQSHLGDLGFYGIRRLIPYAGRLYAMGDDGSAACLQDAAVEG